MTVIIEHSKRDLDVYESWTFLSTHMDTKGLILDKGLIAESWIKRKNIEHLTVFWEKELN
jgi:hypothetical protein